MKLKTGIVFLLGLITLSFGIFSTVLAISAFSITTADTPITVNPGGTATITYLVRNVSGINMTQMKYFPPAMTRISGGTCNATLANGASCNIVLTFTAPSTTGTLILGSLGVCGFNGRICGVPNSANRVHVTIGPTTPPIHLIHKAYVVNNANTDNSVSVIDTLTDVVTTTFSVGGAPQQSVILPNNTKVYVGNVLTNDVSVISTATDTVTATIGPITFPLTFAVLSDGSKVYVLSSTSPVGAVIEIDPVNDTIVGAPIPVGDLPQAMIVTPNNQELYIANLLSDNVTVIKTTDNTVVDIIPMTLGDFPQALAVLPDGSKVYVANPGNNNVGVISTTAGHPVFPAVPFGAGAFPGRLVATPDSTKVFAAVNGTNVVGVIAVGTPDTLMTTIALGGATSPNNLALTPDGSKLYVTDGGVGADEVSVIQTATNTFLTNIPMGAGAFPVDLAVTPDGLKVYVTNNGAMTNTVGVISTATDSVITMLTTGFNPFPGAISVSIAP